ncbi:hypothetical protein [Corynebacterium glaucum]|nr:hypothetical protein [Corynebacterium glaucum]
MVGSLTMYYADIRNRITPIPTPPVVRAVGSLGVAGSAAALVSQAPIGIKVAVALVCVAATLGVTLAHPYRKQMAAFAERENVSKVPSISMLLPVMLWWLALMLAPLAQWPTWGAVLTLIGGFGVAWVLYPHVDGTRRLAYA